MSQNNNRVFKFRAWAKPDQRMSLPFELADSVMYFSSSRALCASVVDAARNPEDWVIMQATGLQDSAGRDIYEGDILKAHDLVDAVIWDEEHARFRLQRDRSRMTPPGLVRALGICGP